MKDELRKSANGQECLVRAPGICNFNSETTVLAHQGDGGMGGKSDDIFGAFACSACHSLLDGPSTKNFTKDDLRLLHHQANRRTQQWWLDNGYITYRGMEQ